MDSDKTRPLEKTGILIVDDQPTKCMGLAQIINEQADLVVRLESENIAEALDAVEKKQVDFAIVEVLSPAAKNDKLEKIKLAHPDLPVLILSMRGMLLNEKGQIPNYQVNDQIIKVLRYVQSLLKSKILGFTVFVEIEKVGQPTKQ
ncbi:response regulator [Planctomycetota bacterium]